MTAYLETSPNTFTPWHGEPIGGIRYPLSITTKWDAPALEALGLFVPAAAEPVPEGKVIVGTTVQRVGDVVQFVHELENAPPPAAPSVVSMRQARLALLGAGLLSQVDTALDQMDEPNRSAAMIEWEYATELRRDHPLVASLSAALELTEQQIDDLFMAAGSIA